MTMSKRILLSILLLFIAAIICTYLFIPGTIVFRHDITVDISPKAFTRTINDESRWKQWWPGSIDNNDPGTFVYNSRRYSIAEKKITSLVVSIKNREDSLPTELLFVPVQSDTMSISWVASYQTSNNPYERIRDYFTAKELSSDMKEILKHLKKYYSNEDNIYGMHIKKDFVLDSILVSTFTINPTYPGTETIYTMIDELQKYAKKNGAFITGYPMLNITPRQDSSFLTRVALPVNKKLPNSGRIEYKWMLGGGNILVTEVKGGPGKIDNAFAEMERYVNDHSRVAPAIPFQSLITDRTIEKDTSKWVTKVYWPVM